ncbi:deoxyribose-phosphate aldolase [Lachnoclostridium sp. An169]|uniref:deoxyribose-phosphate aldolase n=1 Tax=Lachnoclostridium sp. An169 TaxID=1965569 RepID=UPI000B380BFD|nr:deoxyribose-phosphate aldolase [Lachnoclostridium sp. An169]OUP84913.1 deoxyribose-phosphate aldolase [Lachnoclostridium sp. An169]HJA66857.1 deoxyribose-phosphate aldolase [Candidatus Mediterraneibacter cottocaccae]
MDYAKMIDHTLLKPEASKEQIRKLCQEAEKYGFHSVCVNSSYVYFCAQLLKDTDVKVCTVIGFPLGAASTAAKAAEARAAVDDGAEELDMVIHVGMIKSGDWDYVKQDIASVVEAAGGKALVKVILETCLLTDEEKEKACLICKEAGADFVKTSTGFSTGGATEEDVALMRKTVGADMGVKASGGIRSIEDAQRMVQAGADRLGTSSGIAIAEAAGKEEA